MKKAFTTLCCVAVCATASALLPVPAAPTIDSWAKRGFMNELKVTVPAVDTEGWELDCNNLYYRFYLDGNPFTFTKAEYAYIEDDMAELAWGYQDAGGAGSDIIVWATPEQRRIYFYTAPADELVVESLYRVGDEVSVSARYVYDIKSGEGHVVEPVDNTPVLTELPATARLITYTEDTWMMAGYNLQHYTWSGRFDQLGVDGDDIYIKDICGMYRFSTYVRGQLIDGGATMRLPMGQHVFHQDEDGASGAEPADVYLRAAHIDTGSESVVVDMDVEYVDFSVSENGVITLDNSHGVAYVGHDGHVLARNIGFVFAPFDIDRETVTPPGDAVLSDYFISFANEPDATRTKRAGIRLAMTDDEVYVQGLARTMKDGWVKGHFTDGKVIFPSAQYVGTYVNDSGDKFAVYFNGAEATDEKDLFGRVYATREYIEFDYDKFTRTFSSDECITETIGAVNPLSHLVAPVLSPVKEPVVYKPAEPAMPVVESWEQRGYAWALVVRVPAVDADGEAVDTDALIYRLFVDNEPVTFDTSTYAQIESDMTDLPWGYQDAGGYGYDIIRMTNDDELRRIYFYESPRKISIESEYTVDGVTNTSRRYAYDTLTGIGAVDDLGDVGAVMSDEIVATEYFDLSGRRVDSSERGIVIRRRVCTDGRVCYDKVIR